MESVPRILSCGEVLWDIIEDREHIGGAPFNLAAHLARLGCSSHMLTCIGDDPRGKTALAEMQRLGVDASLVQIDPHRETGWARVQLNHRGSATYLFPDDPAYDHISLSPETLRQIERLAPDVICFGTLQQRGDETRASLMRLLDTVPSKHRFFDVNLRRDFYPADVLRESFRRSTIVKLNDEEVPLVSSRLFGSAMADAPFAARLIGEYPIRVVCITRGGQGCSIYTASESRYVESRPVQVVDTVGAGDAFSAAFLDHFSRTADPFESARRGNLLGGYVASRRGAVPEYDEGIWAALSRIPEDTIS